MTDAAPVLSLEDVTIESDYTYDSALWNVRLSLAAGEMALVKLEQGHLRLPLADVAEGLIEPEEGAVQFLGQEWRRMPAAEASRRRGLIGRVFDGQAWVSDLDVDENITMSPRHHTNLTEREILEQASALSRAFGLPGLPRGKPSQVRRQDLQRAACTRAFLGRPRLLILERPTAGIFPEIMQPLIRTLREARAGGAAVLWTTSELGVWNETALKPTFRYAMSGSQMLVI